MFTFSHSAYLSHGLILLRIKSLPRHPPNRLLLFENPRCLSQRNDISKSIQMSIRFEQAEHIDRQQTKAIQTFSNAMRWYQCITLSTGAVQVRISRSDRLLKRSETLGTYVSVKLLYYIRDQYTFLDNKGQDKNRSKSPFFASIDLL